MEAAELGQAQQELDLSREPVPILLVDDNPQQLRLLEDSLGDPAYRIVTAQSGPDALKELLSGHFALVILDVRMPGMDGFEVARLLRSRGKTSNLPIIFLSGWDLIESQMVEPYRLGAVDFIQKPFNDEVLRAKVRVFVDLYLARRVLEREVARRKRLEEELRARVDDLGRSNADLEQFAYAASHDLQEPLRMVSSFVQLLEADFSGTLGADGLRYVKYAVDGAERMKLLINDLLAYSRVGRQELELEDVDTAGLVAQTLSEMEPALRAAQAEIRVVTLPVVRAQPTLLRQVFQNLIENALKYRSSDRSPKISIVGRAREKDQLLTVEDNGIGFDPRHAEKIFGVFQRLHDRSSYEGNGIGLALAKRIVERHGGRIWASSQPDKGSTFQFTIPVPKESAP